MPHGRYMGGTRLDYLLTGAVLLFLTIFMSVIIRPWYLVKLKRDAARSEAVREIMTSVIELSLYEPDKYQALLTRLESRNGSRFILSDNSSCASDFGAYCPDAYVPDDCLPSDEIFKDKRGEEFDKYSISLNKGLLTVISCEGDTRPIFLETLVK